MGGVFMLTPKHPIKIYLSSLQPQPVEDPCSHPGMSCHGISFVHSTAMLSLLGGQHICISFAVAAHPDTPQSMDEHETIHNAQQRMLHILAQPAGQNIDGM